jgi:hypothetical protein
VLDRFYIVDSNTSRLVAVNRNSLASKLIDVMPSLQLSKEGLLQYLPNLHRGPEIKVGADKVIIKFNLKNGWKINEMGPSFVNLLEIENDSNANLVATFDWSMIKNKDLNLPKLDPNKNYILQGVIYYCEKKENSLCCINSYEQRIIVDESEHNKVIDVMIE